jgi:hypothetical protein
METSCVFFEVRTGLLNVIYMSFVLQTVKRLLSSVITIKCLGGVACYSGSAVVPRNKWYLVNVMAQRDGEVMSSALNLHFGYTSLRHDEA